jgi:hypothetical protein
VSFVVFVFMRRHQVVRTGNAVTVLAGFPHRHVQIVLRIYKSPAEVLMGFDIDSYAIAVRAFIVARDHCA